MIIRPATPSDAPALAALLTDYLVEQFPGHPGMSAFDSAECHCAGAAFRRLADLHGQPLREIARGLPPKEWNYVK